MVNLLMTAEFRSFTLFVPGLIRLKVLNELFSDEDDDVSSVPHLSGQAPLLPAH